jgi:hypothetical protein
VTVDDDRQRSDERVVLDDPVTDDDTEVAADADTTGASAGDDGPAGDIGRDDGAVVDELPEDLDVTALVGVYEFPNNSRRRIASILYLVVGVLCVWLGLGVDSPLVNGGVAIAGIGLIAFAVYSYVVAVDTRYDETDALVAAAKVCGFVPGPAAAQMTWRGWRSRPVWRVLLFSDEEQPLHRAIVLVDGVTGEVLEHFVEDNPEDWSQL